MQDCKKYFRCSSGCPDVVHCVTGELGLHMHSVDKEKGHVFQHEETTRHILLLSLILLLANLTATASLSWSGSYAGIQLLLTHLLEQHQGHAHQQRPAVTAVLKQFQAERRC